MADDSFEAQVGGVAALDHPLSRRAYQLVLDEGWVSRDAAAQILGVARSVAAFHLDKLVEAALLRTRYERTSGRTGPGAGRPAKLYGRSPRQIEVSLPPRRYDLAGALLAEAVARTTTDAIPITEAVSQVARETGERTGGETRRRRQSRAVRGALMDVLARHGYEPRRRVSDIQLVNCPFHRLAEEHRELICGMNLEFVAGVIDGVGGTERFEAKLAAEPDACCVRLCQRAS
jgi:predicted ArsR family transcriptional regulator